MAESSGENPGELTPQQQFEIPKETQQGQEVLAERAIEQRQVSENTPAKQAPKFPTQTAVAAPPAQQTQQATQSTTSGTPPLTARLQAQDTDLIEKEWVDKAKTIVAQTQDDPFKQKNEISKVKVDYIKKRFNKSIPLDDTVKS